MMLQWKNEKWKDLREDKLGWRKARALLAEKTNALEN